MTAPIIIKDSEGNNFKVDELIFPLGICRNTIIRRYHKGKTTLVEIIESIKDISNYSRRRGEHYKTIFGKMYRCEIIELSEGTTNSVSYRIKSRGSMCPSIFFTNDPIKFKKQCKIHGIITHQHRSTKRYKNNLKNFDKVKFCCKGNIINYKCLNYSSCSNIWALCGQHHDRYKSNGDCYMVPHERRINF